ncbi:MAG: flavodoxin family protein [Eubacteriales bacterium]|nr:flavodoxin family protein [Eubacteriales bacterium]
MRGMIVYSSKTGNTEKLARRLYEAYKDRHELTLCSVKEFKSKKDDAYDFILFGGWIDRAMPDKKILKAFKKTTVDKVGFFVTMGAEPVSEHGDDCKKNLLELMQGRDSLGYAILPGIVDPKLVAEMDGKGWKAKVIPERVRIKMVEAGKNSRMPTEEEYEAAIRAFDL